MGFEELFENRDKYHGNYGEERFPVNNRYIHESHRSSQRQDNHLNWLDILEKIKSNKKLKLFVVLAGLLVLKIIIVLIIVLLP